MTDKEDLNPCRRCGTAEVLTDDYNHRPYWGIKCKCIKEDEVTYYDTDRSAIANWNEKEGKVV